MKKSILISIISTILISCGMGKLVDSSKSHSYFIKSGDIYFSPDGNWFELGYDKCHANTKSFKVLSESIGKDRNAIFSGYKIQAHVDYSTFIIDEKDVPKDKNNVYEIGQLRELEPVEISGLDVQSFEYLEAGRRSKYGWAKDKNRYYFKQKSINIDYESFKFCTEDFFYDKDSLYTDLGNWKIVTIKSINKTPKKLNEKYIIADETIFFVGQDSSRKIELKTFDCSTEAPNVKVISKNVLSIKNTVLYYGEVFSDADASTFQKVSDSGQGSEMDYYRDKDNVFFDKKKIEKANPTTFSTLRLGYAIDENHVFYKTKVLKDADPKSFREDENEFMEWIDNNGNRFDWKGKKIN